MIIKYWKKITSAILIVSFCTLEIGLAQPMPVSDLLQSIRPEKNPEEKNETPRKLKTDLSLPDSLSFLESDSPLQFVDSDILLTKEVPASMTEALRQAESRPERASFEEALEELRPEYASAVILESLSAENLKALTELSFETAIVVLNGEIVLFSTGDHDEIGVTSPAQELLKNASFISHVHVGESERGPSSYDLQAAVDESQIEYVITSHGAYAYNIGGLVNDGKGLSLSDYLARIQNAQAFAVVKDQTAARQELNQFIREMDAYNELTAAEKLVYRRGNTLEETFGRDGNGVIIQRVRTTKNSSGQTLSHEDTRYLNGQPTSRTYYEYDSQGRYTLIGYDIYFADGSLRSSTLTEYSEGLTTVHRLLEYYSDGKFRSKSVTEYGVGTGIRHKQTSESYDSSGKLTMMAKAHFDSVGNSHQYEDRRFENELLRSRTYYDYDPQGKIILTRYDQYFSSGELRSTTEAEYTESKLSIYRTIEYDTLGQVRSNGVTNYWPGTGLRQNSLSESRDSNGYLTMVATTQFDTSGNYLNYEDRRFDHEILRSRTYYEYDLAGRFTRVEIDLFYNSGEAQSSSQTEYAEGKTTAYSIKEYTKEGWLRSKGNMRYRDGTGIRESNLSESYDSSGKLTMATETLYDLEGNYQSYNDQRFESGNLKSRTYYEYDKLGRFTKMDIDLYFLNGFLLSHQGTEYNEGSVIRSLMETYSADGVPKSKEDIRYWPGSGQRKQNHHIEAYDAVGRVTRIANVFYDELGKISAYEDLRFLNDFRTLRLYYEYDALGRYTLQQEDRYDAVGQIQISNETTYLDGKRSVVRVQSYASTGRLLRDYWYFYDASGAKNIDYYNYNYENESAFSFTHYHYFADGSFAMETIEVISPLKTSQSNYALTYKANGQTYTQNVNLEEGDNIISRLDAIDLKVNIPVALKTSDYKVDLTQPIPSRTAQSSLTIHYKAGSIEKVKTIPLLEGPNRFLITEKDANGYAASLQIDVVLDTTPPRIVMISQVPLRTRESKLEIVYTSDQIEKKQNFELQEGNNTITFSEKDDLGNEIIKTWTVVLDTTPPEIIVTTNVPTLTNASDLMIKYTADGTSKEKKVHLTEGTNTIEIREADDLGNEVLKTMTLTLDTIAPEVMIEGSLPAKTKLSELKIQYTEDGVSKDAVFLLKEGLNTLEIVAQDAAGNRTVKVISIERDTLPPELVVTSSVPARTKTAALSIHYTVDGAEQIKEFQLLEGENTLTVSASDELGNEIKKSFSVVLDTQAPEIVVTDILPAKTKASEVTVHFEVDGVARQKSFSLSEGSNTLTLEAADDVGNKAVKIVEISRDSTPPEIIIPNFPPARTNQTTMTIAYREDGVSRTMTFQLLEGENVLIIRAEDELGNESTYSVNVIRDTAGPNIELAATLPTHTNQSPITLVYRVDGVEREKIFELLEGTNSLVLSEADDLGNQSFAAYEVILDTQGPLMEWAEMIQPATRHDLMLRYRVDGILHEKLWELKGLPGPRELELVEKDDLGNESRLSVKVHFDPPAYDRLLDDGTVLSVMNDHLSVEAFADGTRVLYDAMGHIQKYEFSDDQSLEYGEGQPQGLIQRKNSQGELLESIGALSKPKHDTARLIRTSLENGISIYYQNGIPVLMELVNGTRVYDFKTAEDGTILEALLEYPDEHLELIRNGVLLRRQSADGLVMDYLPDGRLVREISINGTGWYDYEKDQSGKVVQTTVVYSGAESVTYGADGLWTQLKKEGQEYLYIRQETESGLRVLLDTPLESAPLDRLPVEFKYTLEGELQKIMYSDDSVAVYEQGLLVSYTDAEGHAADYHAIMKEGIVQGVAVQRGGAELIYDEKGFLTEIISDQGTLIRSKKTPDSAANGLSDEDTIQILLETVGGDKLSDFELDSEGRILKGILETKEGIKQTIENGVMTGFETVDGKIYGIRDTATGSEAYLREWKLRDGSTVIYGNGTIAEILMADGRRLDQIGFNAQKVIQRYTENFEDGTQKDFENGILRRLVTVGGIEIQYDTKGILESIHLPDEDEQRVSYRKDAAGELQEIILDGVLSQRIYAADGVLKSVLSEGIRANFSGGEVSSLETLFGRIENPQFDDLGRLDSGAILFEDGSIQTIQDGVVLRHLYPDGTLVEYDTGRVDTINIPINAGEDSSRVYKILYGDGTGGVMEDIRMRLESEPGQPEVSLIRFLENPTEVLDEIQGLRVPDVAFDFKGDSRIETNNAAVGDGALRLDSIDDYLEAGDSGDFDFGNGDFTIEAWVNFESSSGGYPTIASKYVNGNGWIFSIEPYWGDLMLYNDGWSRRTVHYGHFEQNQWYHVAVERTGYDIKFFVNGQQVGEDLPAAETYDGVNHNLQVGYYESNFFPGMLDEVRISKGIARYSENFIPPTEKYKMDEYTKVLLHFDSPEAPSRSLNDIKRLTQVLTARSLTDLTDDRSHLMTTFESKAPLEFADLFNDAARGAVYAFGQDYLPSWEGVVRGDEYVNAGFITHNVRLVGDDNLPAQTASLTDINGDGLLDRVYNDENWFSDYWWVQLNTGSGFAAPVKWSGIVRDYNLNGYGYYYANQGVQRFYHGRCPFVMADLKDLNGDHLPDRVMKRLDGSDEWLVQWNTGSGFEEPVLWIDNAIPSHTWYPYEKFAISMRGDDKEENVQDLISDLVDIDGDGLPDRIVRPLVPDDGLFDHWFFQKNLGKELGFADAVIWEGVDNTFGPDAKTGGSIAWYNSDWSASDPMTDLAVLRDINGDGLPDRVLTKAKNTQLQDSALDWYVQFNNGGGFEPAVLWDSDVRSTSVLGKIHWGTAINAITDVWTGRQVYVDLKDVTGDGRPDRIVVDLASSGSGYSWYVEVNDGTTFLPAVEWTGIQGDDLIHAAIVQDDENFRMNVAGPVGGLHDRLPHYVEAIVDLRDINGDGIADRILTERGQDHWQVQFGTGSGFLPATEMHVESLGIKASGMNAQNYDYLSLSLKASELVTSDTGHVKIELVSSDENASVLQAWVIDSLSADWNDLLLPLNVTDSAAAELKLTWISQPEAQPVTIFMDGARFVSLRPEASKDWLNRFLTEEDSLSHIYDARNQTFAGLLASSSSAASDVENVDWQKLLQAETLIEFDNSGETEKFENLYGTVSHVENGRVTQSIQPDGSVINFDGTDQMTLTQTQVNAAGDTVENVSTAQLSYGRVRSLTQTDGNVLEYRYEFCGSSAPAALCEGKPNEEEVTVVIDAVNQVTERMMANRLVSRIDANGVETRFVYNQQGELTETTLFYKGRERQTFEHQTLEDGHTQVKTADGIIEEYDTNGKIVAHITPEGYRYRHTFEKAQQVVTATETQTTTLADGSTMSFEMPVVTLVDDPNGEEIHRVTLESFSDAGGVQVDYDSAQQSYPRMITFNDGTIVTITDAVLSEGDGEDTQTSLLIPSNVIVRHPDGTIHEFTDGLPSAVVSATGLRIDIKDLSNETCSSGQNQSPCSDDLKKVVMTASGTESSEFHHAQALKLWQDLVMPNWNQYALPPTLVTASDYDKEGHLQTRQYAEGTVETYQDGRIQDVLSPEGERLVHYSYDEEGNPTRIEMEGSRRRLSSTVLQMKAEVAMQRAEALHHLAEREQVVHETIEGDYLVTRNWLLTLRAQIESQRDKVGNISVRGKTASALIGGAMAQISAGIDQVNSALNRLATDHSNALENLTTQVAETNQQIESQTAESYLQIAAEEAKATRAILQEEVTPIVYHWYRKILGRDPSESEYDQWINSAIIASPDGVNSSDDSAWLITLKTQLNDSDDLIARRSEVNAIKERVASKLNQYTTWSAEDKVGFAESLGINVVPVQVGSSSELVSLSSDEINNIINWLTSQSLHFGQSAYIALEALLKQDGYALVACQDINLASDEGQCYTRGNQWFSRVQLATELILTDILSGILTPLESGDLVISLYAMQRFAARHGLNTDGYSLDYAALRAIFSSPASGGGQVGADDPLFTIHNPQVVAHINGNHYVIITKVTDTEVTYIDPGMGAESALQTTTLSKEDFLKVWLNSAIPGSHEGVIFSENSFVANEVSHKTTVLTTPQTMRVRGAFFPLIFLAIAAVISAAVSAVTAVVTAIVGVITAILGAIGGALASLGTFVTGAFGSFLSGAQALLGGVVHGLGAIGGAIKTGFLAVHGALLGGIQGVAGAIPYFGGTLSAWTATAAFSNALGLGLISAGLQGLGTLADKIGISPKFSRTIISIGKVIGGVALAASGNPFGLVGSLSFISSGTSEFLNLHSNLSPTLTNVIGIGATAFGAFAGGGFNPNLTGIELFKQALPSLSMDFAGAGIAGIGGALGFDWRLKFGLGIVARAAVGSAVNGLMGGGETVVGFRDDGTKITVSSPADLGDFIGGAIQTAPQEINLNLSNPVADGIDPLNGFRINAPELLNNTTNTPGFFDKLVNSLKDAAISAKNFLGPVAIAATPSIISSFNQAQLNNGLSQTLNENVTVVFDRPTIENIFSTQGGIDAILAQGTAPVTLPDQSIVNGYKFSDTTTLLFDQNNEFIGQLRNGRYEIGEFSITGNSEFILKDGQIIELLDTGEMLRVYIEDGQIINIEYLENGGESIFSIEGQENRPIFIEGPKDKEFTFDIIDAVIKLGKNSAFGFTNGILRTITQLNLSVNRSEEIGEINGPSHTYVLNGINNPNAAGQVPEYLDRLIQKLADSGVAGATGITLFEGTNQLSGAAEFVADSFLTLTFSQLSANMSKIYNSVAADIASGVIQVGDTINMIAHSGAGQAVLAVASKLFESFGLKLNVSLYGSPVFWPILSSNVVNMQVLNGDADELIDLISKSTYPLYPAQFLIRGGRYVQETLAGIHHIAEPTYHSDQQYQDTGLTYIEYLAQKIANFLTV